MDLAEARALLAFDRWANARVLERAEALAAGRFARPVLGESVRDLLVRILSTEWVWIERWTGRSPAGPLSPAAFASPGDLRRGWQRVEPRQRAFLAELRGDGLRREVTYRDFDGREHRHCLADLLRQLVLESAAHRDRAALLLRELGAPAPPLDWLAFLAAGMPDARLAG